MDWRGLKMTVAVICANPDDPRSVLTTEVVNRALSEPDEPGADALSISERLTTTSEPFSVSEYEIGRLTYYEQMVLKKTAQKRGWVHSYNPRTGSRDFTLTHPE
jgi:hypothetical protein